MEVRAQIQPWRTCISFLLIEGGHVGKVTMEEADSHRQTEPSFNLDETAAQVLMDDLWNCGIRPTEGTGSAGSLRATEKHLNDMRKIVSKQIGVEL